MSADPLPTCGTVAPTTEAVLDAVRELNGRRAVRPAETVEAAVSEVRDFLVVLEWHAGDEAAAVAARVLQGLHGVEPSASPWRWSLYAEAARQLGFPGAVPVPVVGTGRPAEA